MNNFDYTNLTTRELLEKAMNGEIPIPRNNPKFGESKYFFMKMGSDPYASISDAETFDVPDDVDPFEFRDNGYSSLKPETFQSALAVQKQAELSPSLETPDILDANALTPDTLGEKQPSWLNDVLGAQNQLQNGSFGGGLTNNYLNNNTFGLSENNYLNNNAFASNGVNGYLNNNAFGLGDNTYLNNNAFASNGANSYLNNSYLDNIYLNNNAFMDNGANSLFAPMPLNQNSVRFADNPTITSNTTTNNNLDWGVLFNALFGVKPAVAATLDGQGINNQAEPFNYDSYDFDITPDINRHMLALKSFEGAKERIYFDGQGLATVGIGKQLTDDAIFKNEVWNLLSDQQRALKNAVKQVDYLFKPGGALHNLEAPKQYAIFKALVDGNDIKTATNGKVETLTQQELEALKHIYSFNLSPERMEQVVRDHYTKIKPTIKSFLKKHNLKWEDLTEGQRDQILDIAYNPGKGLLTWDNFGTALKNGNKNRASAETHRKGIQASRNNYNLLRGLSEFENMPVDQIMDMLKYLDKEDLTRENFDQYKHIHKLEYNPFNH